MKFLSYLKLCIIIVLRVGNNLNNIFYVKMEHGKPKALAQSAVLALQEFFC